MSVDIFHIKLGLNSCYLIRGKNIVMIDGGMPNKLRTFRMQLSRFNIQPEEVKLIVLTHSHFDHAGLPVFAQDIDSIMANWKFLIDRGAKMVYPGHGKPFPIEVMKKILN